MTTKILEHIEQIDARVLVLRPSALYTAFRKGRAAIDREIVHNDLLSSGDVTVTVIVTEVVDEKVAE